MRPKSRAGPRPGRGAVVPEGESDPRESLASGEDELVALAQAGDDDAFAALVQHYSPRLQGVLFRITRDPETVHDALQDALLRAWQNIDRFQSRSSFFTWITRIAINEAYRTLRRNDAAGALPLDDAIGERIPGWGDRPDEVFESREFLAATEAALAQMPIEYRTVVVLRDVEGLSTADAAEALGIGERALKSRLHRGRMALRRALDEFFEPD